MRPSSFQSARLVGEIPNPKSQTSSKLQTAPGGAVTPVQRREIGGGLGFRIWNLFGIWVLGFGICFQLTGCAGYKLGPTNGLEAGARTIQIHPPVNKTFEPRLAVALNQQLRKQLQRDGTYKLETHGEGDVVVTTTILRYEKTGESFQPRDTLTARDYRVVIRAHVTAYDRVSGKNLVDREFRGRTSVRPGSDQSSAELQALPLLAEDLARNITSALVDGEW